jgi:hypothetical protein
VKIICLIHIIFSLEIPKPTNYARVNGMFNDFVEKNNVFKVYGPLVDTDIKRRDEKSKLLSKDIKEI